ncbi:MAG: YceI family protein [Myxococcales bacterium]
MTPAGGAQSDEVTAELAVTLHGVTRRLEAPFELHWTGSRRVQAIGHFDVKLSDFQVKRAALFAVPIGNTVPIEVDLTWTAVPSA